MIVFFINVGDNVCVMVVGMDCVFKKNILNFVGVSLFDEIEVENLRMLGRYFKKDSVINLCRFEIV